ncbi:MAG TPA: helix-turn-helix domain-containing protein [Longimicrobium sp.]|jgi:hypothetical protein
MAKKMAAQQQQGAGTTKFVHAQISDVIGEELAVKISEAFGGRELYIAHKPPARSTLVTVVGQLAAVKLARAFGGVSFKIPLGPGRRARIVRLLSAGKSKREVARELACTQRTVARVQAEHEIEFGPIVPSAPSVEALRVKNRCPSCGAEPPCVRPVRPKSPRGALAQEAAGQVNLFLAGSRERNG